MGKVTILKETTVNPITLMGQRAGVCWGANTENDERNYARGMDCIKSGHGRVLEFVNVELVLEGYSARVIREWYTHIGGAPTRLQASTRYMGCEDFEFVMPPSIAAVPDAADIYEDAIRSIQNAVKTLENELDIPREDAAMLLPLGMKTKIVDKRNLRSLIDMSHQRMCTRAYWEYRELMCDICKALKDYSEEWHVIVSELMEPKCELYGYCAEKKSCGRKPRKGEE